MLSHQSTLVSASAIRQASRHTLPASSIALSRIVSSIELHSNVTVRRTLHSRAHVATTLLAQNNLYLHRSHTFHPHSQWNHRWLSTHPICENIDCEIAKDLSAEEFDSKCIVPLSSIIKCITLTQVSHHILCICRCLQICLPSA